MQNVKNPFSAGICRYAFEKGLRESSDRKSLLFEVCNQAWISSSLLLHSESWETGVGRTLSQATSSNPGTAGCWNLFLFSSSKELCEVHTQDHRLREDVQPLPWYTHVVQQMHWIENNFVCLLSLVSLLWMLNWVFSHVIWFFSCWKSVTWTGRLRCLILQQTPSACIRGYVQAEVLCLLESHQT